MEPLQERPVWSMSGSELLTTLDHLQSALTSLQTRRLELLAALDLNGHAADLGARDTVQLIALRHRLDPIEVRRDLRLATALPKYPEVQAALTRTHPAPVSGPDPALDSAPSSDSGPDSGSAPGLGTDSGSGTDSDSDTGTNSDPDFGSSPDLSADSRADPAPGSGSGFGPDSGAVPGSTSGADTAPVMALHPGQAEAIVTALERIPSTAMVPVENLRVAEQQLVKAAGTLNPGELRKLGKQVRDRLDTDGPEPAEARALAAETLWLKPDDHGVEFRGYLAGAHAELFQTLVFAGAKPHLTPDGQRDRRSYGKRQADALTAILESAAGTGTAVPGHGDIKPHVTVTIDLADLQAGTGTGTLASGATLSVAAIRRLACDAGIIPLVLGSNSEPLDVGTEQRFVTRAIRHALNTRDQGCVVCAAPAAMCEAHHITYWADGGTTNITNLALLCKAHHQGVHQGQWTLTVRDGRPHASTPIWATPTPRSSKDPPPAAA